MTFLTSTWLFALLVLLLLALRTEQAIVVNFILPWLCTWAIPARRAWCELADLFVSTLGDEYLSAAHSWTDVEGVLIGVGRDLQWCS